MIRLVGSKGVLCLRGVLFKRNKEELKVLQDEVMKAGKARV